MAAARYQITLYGHSGSDPDVFVNNLAIILGLAASDAAALMQSLPVKVKEDLDKGKAGALAEALKLIGALCIVNPMPGYEAEEELFEKAPPNITFERSEQQAWDWRDSLAFFRTPNGVMIAAGVVVCVVLATFLWLRDGSDGRTIARSGEKVEGLREKLAAMGVAEVRNTGELEATLNALEQEGAELQEQLALHRENLHGLRQNWPADFPSVEDVNAAKRAVVEAQTAVRQNAAKVRSLKKRLRDISVIQSVEQMTGSRPAPAPSAGEEEEPVAVDSAQGAGTEEE